MKTVDVTLVGILSEFTSDGGPVEISGALFAKAFTRARIETASKVLFESDKAITIAVGNTLAIGKTVTVVLAIDSSEIALDGENLGLGGQLSIGGQRHLIIPTFIINNSETSIRWPLRFASDDGAQHVRADFDVILGNAVLI